MAKRAVSVRVDGWREARASLRKAGADLGDLKQAHDEIAQIIYQPAHAKAPRGRTGKLAGSGRATGQKTAAEIVFGNRIKYARPIHWGWPARHIKPQPFLWNAQQETRPAWTAVYAKAVQRILDRIRGASGSV